MVKNLSSFPTPFRRGGRRLEVPRPNMSRPLAATVLIAVWCFAAAICGAEVELTDEELSVVKAAEADRIRAIETVYGTVVAIYGNNRQGGGSGVLFDESGLALTNHHVVAAAGTEGWAGLADGRLYRWQLIGTDPGGDVAIIRLSGNPQFPQADLGNSETVRVGDWAMAMGNPFVLAEDQKPTVTLGIVSGVKRYQAGSGVNQLVYGNCIQIDSSINPGNSGGPLFNMRGQVIGINGRGSFKERGRVNVGLGYAISSNQIKNFIPDLLATKVAQHGTFDAIFGDREAGVLCETINLDAPVAQLGLQLGDRIVSFDGLAISSANQFTNVVSTVPANWPAELVCEREGKRFTIWTRLLALPYQTHRHRADEPKEEPEQDDEKPDPPPQPIARGPQVSIENPGEIRDEKLNREIAEQIAAHWRTFMRTPQKDSPLKVVQVDEDIYLNGESVGHQRTLLATDGRFRTEVSREGLTYVYVFDGEKYWSILEDDPAEEMTSSKMSLNSDVYWLVTLASAFRSEPFRTMGKVQLDAGDKAQGQISYRLKTIDDRGDWFYVWLGLFDQQGRRRVELLKCGPDADCDRAAGGVIFGDWRTVESGKWPFRRNLVQGLAEDVKLTYTTTRCESVAYDAAKFLVSLEGASR